MKIKKSTVFVFMVAVFVLFFLTMGAQDEEKLRETLNQKSFRLYEEGKDLQMKKELDQSIDKFQQVYTDNKENYFVVSQLAQVYAQKKEYDKAAQMFEKAVKIRNEKGIKDATVFNSLGWVYMMKSDYRNAEKYLKLSLDHIDELPLSYKIKTYNNLGTLFINREDYNEAEKYFNTAAVKYNSSLAKRNLKLIDTFRSNSRNRYTNLAQKDVQRKDFDSALQYFKDALEVQPESKQTIYEIGKIFLKMKRYKEALTQFEKALKADPAFFQARFELIKIYCLLGEKEEAKKMIDREPHLTETQIQDLKNDKDIMSRCSELLN